MVQFNELKINQAGTKLTIDIQVKNDFYYDNVYLNKVSIDTQDTFISSGPSTKTVYSTFLAGNNKSFKLELGITDILPSLLDNMFFVWVETKGTPSSDTPCGEDNTLTLGAVLAWYPLYQQALSYIKEVENTCTPPKEFIDFILRIKALQLAIKTGHATQAVKYYNKFFKNIKKGTVINKCGCYGGIS